MTTYAAEEAAGGAPVELYTFAMAARVWRHTSSELAVTEGGLTYAPAVIRRGAVQASDETASGELEVTLERETPLGQVLLAGALPAPMTLLVRRVQPDATSGDARPFRGRLAAVTADGADVVCTFTAGEADLTRQLLRTRCQRTCNWTLFDGRCGVDPAGFTDACTVAAASGLTATVSMGGAPGTANILVSGWYSAGVLTVGGVRYFVVSHPGSGVLTMLGALPASAVGEAATLSAGCDRAVATCEDKFDNAARFGGFPNIPTTDVWSTSLR